jgi:hypothetical protein
MSKCPACGRTPKRSSEANRRYWALLALIADKVKVQDKYFSRTVWHEYFKEKLLGANEVTLPNGQKRVYSESSAELDTKEFSEYMDKIEAWAANQNVWLEE